MVHDIKGLAADQELEVGMNCRFRKAGVTGVVVSIIQPEGMRIARIRITSDAHKNEMREVYTISGLPRLCDAPGNQFDVVSILTDGEEEVMEVALKEQDNAAAVYFGTKDISALIKNNSKLNWGAAHFQLTAKVFPVAHGKTDNGRRTNLYTKEQAEKILMAALNDYSLVQTLIAEAKPYQGAMTNPILARKTGDKPVISVVGDSPSEEGMETGEALWATGIPAKPIMGSKHFPNENEEAPTFTEEEIGEAPAQQDLLSNLNSEDEVVEPIFEDNRYTEAAKNEEAQAKSADDIPNQLTEPQRKAKKKLKEIEAAIVSETSEKHEEPVKIGASEYAARFKESKISELVIQRELLEIYLDVDDLEMEYTMELSGDDSEVSGKLYSLKERIKELYQLIRFPNKG